MRKVPVPGDPGEGQKMGAFKDMESTDWRTAIDDCANRGAVTFAIGSDTEERAEGGHDGRMRQRMRTRRRGEGAFEGG